MDGWMESFEAQQQNLFNRLFFLQAHVNTSTVPFNFIGILQKVLASFKEG